MLRISGYRQKLKNINILLRATDTKLTSLNDNTTDYRGVRTNIRRRRKLKITLIMNYISSYQ